MMEQDQEQKYVCKLCNKSFLNGKVLGGHMRSHKLTKVSAANPNKSKMDVEASEYAAAGYVLREKPKKSRKFSGQENINQCKECGKDFETLKALTAQKLVFGSQSVRRKRSKRMRYNSSQEFSFSDLNESLSSSVTEIEKEEEEVAMCLIMLSRGINNWDEFVRFNMHKDSDEFGIQIEDFDTCDPELGEDSRKKRELKCKNCRIQKIESKIVPETEANWKQVKLQGDGSSEEEESYELKNSKGRHQCSICFKFFPSGQALGGHKRSHVSKFSGTKQHNMVLNQELADNCSIYDTDFGDTGFKPCHEQQLVGLA